MRKSLVVGIVFGLAGCVGTVTGEDPSSGSGGGSPAELIARAKFESDAYPIFKDVCAACHAGSRVDAPAFVKSTSIDTMRSQLLGFDPQVVNLTAPESSRVLNKGAHDSTPALDAIKSAAILGWLQAEKDASAPTMPVELSTGRITPLLCTSGVAGDPTCPLNHVTLDALGLEGASIDFIAQPLSSDLYISDLYLKASTKGVYLEHPLFVSWPTKGNPIPDSLDRFFAVKLNLAVTTATAVCPGPSCGHIGAGAAAFIGFAPQNQIEISFKVIDIYHPDSSTPPAPVGCGPVAFASFLANVKPVLSPVCVSCHGGANTGAKNAMDLSGLASTTDNNTCLQVRSHVNFTTVAQSGILLAPQAGVDAAHPAGGKLSATTNPTIANFQAKVNTWITAEVAGN